MDINCRIRIFFTALYPNITSSLEYVLTNLWYLKNRQDVNFKSTLLISNSFVQSFQPHYGSGVGSGFNRNERQESSWGKAWPPPKADNLLAFVSRLSRKCEIFNVSQPYRPPRPIIQIALLFFFLHMALQSQYSLVSIMSTGWTPQGSEFKSQ
jgi:hypothetical protein